MMLIRLRASSGGLLLAALAASSWLMMHAATAVAQADASVGEPASLKPAPDPRAVSRPANC